MSFIKTQIKPLFPFVFLISLPWLLFVILGSVYIPFFIVLIKETLAFMLLTLLFIGVAVLIKNKKMRFRFAVVSLFLLFTLVFIKLSFYINYEAKINASALFVIFETNTPEAIEFLSNYFNYKVISVLVFLAIVCVFLLKKIKKSVFKIKSNWVIQLFSIVGFLATCYVINKKFSDENLILKSVSSFKEYKATKQLLKNELAKEFSGNIDVISTSEAQQTYVVIIGESTSNWHMQLYGYNRKTNPLLKEKEEELFVFNNVITPNTHTIIALDKVLTFSELNSPNKKNNASIVQLANHAGFDTFWISNQRPVGIYESIPTLIGSAANHKSFTNTYDYVYDIYDEKLLPHIEKALNTPKQKKMIFVHLMGAHGSYNKRYPPSFNKFLDDKNYEDIVNEYDNAIVYNDSIVRQIINMVKQKNENSYVLYFSDHGDDVLDTSDVLLAHNEYYGTKPMYEIPFIAWFSEKYKKNNSQFFNIDSLVYRPYLMEDFIHSFADVSNIRFKKFNPEKSIFNTNFKIKPRIIKDTINYDKAKK